MVYLRLVGDRSIPESNFGRIQRERTTEIEKWAEEIRSKDDDIERAYVFANNHFQRLAPETVNLMRKEFELESVDWVARIQRQTPDAQRTLF